MLVKKKRSIYHTYWKQFFINILLAFSCATGNENSIMIKSVELENDKKSLLPAIMNLTTHYIMWSWFQGWFLAWNYKKGQIRYQYSLFSMKEKVTIDCLEFYCFFLFHKTYFIKVISFVMLWWKIIWFVIYKVLICDCIKNPHRWLFPSSLHHFSCTSYVDVFENCFTFWRAIDDEWQQLRVYIRFSTWECMGVVWEIE